MGGHTNLYISVETRERLNRLKNKYRFRSNSETIENLLLIFEDEERKIGEGGMISRILELRIRKGKGTSLGSDSGLEESKGKVEEEIRREEEKEVREEAGEGAGEKKERKIRI